MISFLTSILKIVLGALAAHYFHNPFVGGWWAGVLLLMASVTGICSFTGFMLAFNFALNLLTVIVTLFATIVDSLLANYFNFTVNKCGFDENDIDCFCLETHRDYLDLIYYLYDAKCNNVFTRNPQLLIINAALSALCFLSSVILFIFLAIALKYAWFGSRNKAAVQDYTIVV